jgi:hypothetical protein
LLEGDAMRFVLLCLLALVGCAEEQSPEDLKSSPADQCLAGADSVDGVRCCHTVTASTSCAANDYCIAEQDWACSCRDGLWHCSSFVNVRDLAVQLDLGARDLASTD